MQKAAFWVAMMLFIAGAGFAQPLTISVKDGTVVINGREIPPQELPAGLDVSGLNQTMRFTDTDDFRILVEISGRFFGIENGRLVDSSEAGVHVFPGHRFDINVLSNRAEQLAETLALQAADLQKIRSEAGPNLRESIKAAENSVVQAARIIEMVPMLNMQNYFSDLEREDKILFRRLVEESRMEMAAARLAAEIQMLPDGAERNRRLEELRGQLNEIFDYMQLNRRQEIQQLEREIAALHVRVEKREAARESLIERRLHELIGRE